MRRAIWCLPLLLAALPAQAQERQHYGPLGLWNGIGFKHSVRDDGSWRIVSEARGVDGDGFALNVAMYRAAELAREQGYDYVQFLGGSMSRSRIGSQSAIILARPSYSADAPACPRKRDCYTADAARLITLLSYNGRPGVAAPSGVDEYGRTVTYSGFGLAAAGGAAARAAAPVPPIVPLPTQAIVAPRAAPVAASAPSYEDRLAAARPVAGSEPKQGWTISD